MGGAVSARAQARRRPARLLEHPRNHRSGKRVTKYAPTKTPGIEPIKSEPAIDGLTSPMRQCPNNDGTSTTTAKARSVPTSRRKATTGATSNSKGSVSDPAPIDVMLTVNPTKKPINANRNVGRMSALDDPRRVCG